MLHIETVTPTLLNLIKVICAEPFFQQFRLVGGTALSLDLGHRMSVDADFFTNAAFEQVGKDIENAVKTYYQTLKNLKEQAETDDIRRRIEAIKKLKK
jgi:hypothetical protein